ncbi:hypothetical protein BsWGS_25082 [Bradybaena similaris]
MSSLAIHSLRARFGDKGIMNSLHVSENGDAGAREQALLSPNFQLPTEDGEEQQKRENIQWTLAILRPELFATKKSAVLEKISQLGFKIIMCKETQMTKKQAAKFFKEMKNEAYFSFLLNTMCSGTFLALTLAKDDAIKAWKEALGPPNIDEAMEIAPQSLRAQFPGTSGMNQLHGSDNEASAKAEIAYFFPMEQTLAVIKPHAMEFKDEIIASITRVGFKIAASKEKTISRKDAEVLYEKQEESPFYEDLLNSMTSGPGLFMALSRQGAISGWRLEMGHVDPEVAKATNPDSLRAKYGSSILFNGVHGSSNEAQAKTEMYTTCGFLVFNEDGTVRDFELLSREERQETLLWQMSEEELRNIILPRNYLSRRDSDLLVVVYMTVLILDTAYQLTKSGYPLTHCESLLLLLKIICSLLCFTSLCQSLPFD